MPGQVLGVDTRTGEGIVHRLYLERTASAIAMTVLSRTVVGLLIAGPWALIDTIRYPMMSDREFAARYVGD